MVAKSIAKICFLYTTRQNMTEAGTSVRLSFQSRFQLLLADESSGVTVRMKKLFRDFHR